jgi:hypothetical protein
MKYFFAVNGQTKKVEEFDNDLLAFEHRCRLEKETGENWKVYNQRGDLVYGVAIMIK